MIDVVLKARLTHNLFLIHFFFFVILANVPFCYRNATNISSCFFFNTSSTRFTIIINIKNINTATTAATTVRFFFIISSIARCGEPNMFRMYVSLILINRFYCFGNQIIKRKKKNNFKTGSKRYAKIDIFTEKTR